MRKSFIICLALVLTFFTMPFGGITAAADEKVYDDIADGEYEITINLLKKGTDEKSAAADYMNEEATLIIDGEQIKLTFYIPDNPAMKFSKFEVEGLEPAIEEVDEMFYYSFTLNELKTKLSSIVSYEVPMINLEHENVEMDIGLVGLDELPEKDEPEGAPEEREVGKLLTEKEADKVYQLSYETDSQATAGQLENPVKLLEKNNKKYIQIPINEKGAQYFRSLKVNEKEVTWNSITEGPYTIQFELPNGIEDELDVSMVIQAGPTVMPHDDIKLWFNEDSLETIKPKPEKIEIEQGTKVSVKANDTIIVKNSQGTQLTMPENLPDDVNVTINSSEENIQDQNGLEVAGDVLTFTFENLGENPGNFELVMTYDQDKFNSNDYDLDIHYYDEEISEWVAQEGAVENGKITVNVDHFSTYGVFAKAAESPEKPEEPEESDDTDDPSTPIEAPDNAEEIDYVVLHENGKDISTADQFFIKPGLLFEKDGKQFVEVTINSSNMIKDLSSFDTDAIIVKENDDGSIVVQFQVNDDLSDTLLKMRIVVPGLYDTEHTALFSFIDEDTSGDPGQSEEDPKDDPKEDPKEEPKEEPNEIPVESKLVPDKAFEIDYNIKQIDSDQDSVANNFFTGKAILLEKDGESFVQLTIKNGDMIKDLKNKYGEALLIKENNDGSIVVQLKVDNDLSDLKLEMHIVVPDGAIEGFPGYDEQHEAILVFDKGSKKEIEVGDYRLAGSDHPIIGEEEGPGSPEKPEFGDKDDTDTNGKDTDKSGETDNPQTGDTTNIFLYAMLLIGSLTPLAVKLRRRFN